MSANHIKFSKLKPLQGLGKLSQSYLYRLVSKRVRCLDGQYRNGASKLELLAVIYLSQIADVSGYVAQFRIKDFAQILRCSEREVYYIMENLVAKEYVQATFYENRKWTGFRDIKLIGNDFSDDTLFQKGYRYVSSFYSFFDWSDANMASLEKLSLYAIRILLLILFFYNFNHGCKLKREDLCELLGIKDKSLVRGYLKELEEYLFYSKFSEIVHSGAANEYIRVFSKNAFMTPDNKPKTGQMSYYKRKWLLHLLNNKAVVYNDPSLVSRSKDYILTMNDILEKIFSLVSSYLLKGHLLSNVERAIETVFREAGYILDLFSLSRMDLRLMKALDEIVPATE